MFRTFKDAAAHLGKRDRRKLANNTYLIRRDDRIAVRLYETDIIAFFERGGSMYLHSGGFRTVTTKDRMNRFQGRVRVFTERGVWYVSRGQATGWKKVPYTDGFKVGPRGGLYPKPGEPDAAKLRARIRKYAADFEAQYEAGKVRLPGGGDCWFCLLVDHAGNSWGDRESEHLTSHLSEAYYVPAMLRNAMKEAALPPLYYADWQHRCEVNTRGYLGHHWVARTIRKYLYRQLGV